MAEEHPADCECGIPEGAVVINRVEIVEYMTSDGQLHTVDFSHDSSGEEIDHGKLLEMIEWCRMLYQAPILADMIMGYMQNFEDDE